MLGSSLFQARHQFVIEVADDQLGHCFLSLS
jgi:hypothetical protein